MSDEVVAKIEPDSGVNGIEVKFSSNGCCSLTQKRDDVEREDIIVLTPIQVKALGIAIEIDSKKKEKRDE